MRPAAEWTSWGLPVRLVLTDPAAQPAARGILERTMLAVEAACSRFREDSEVWALERAGGGTVPVSPLLAELVAVALRAAEESGGSVDPSMGEVIARLGYDRDIATVPADRPDHAVTLRVRPSWRMVRLDGRRLTLPPGVLLDLGATAKAWTADRCAADIAHELGCGALVGIGGDIATAGPAPVPGWRVLVQDGDGDGEPADRVVLPAGMAIATSSTIRRTWRRAGRTMHHVIDPASARPVRRSWRTVTVAAPSCVRANTRSTAAIVRRRAALPWLAEQDATVLTLGAWPRQGHHR